MVFEEEDLSAALASLENTETHHLFEEVKAPASQTIDDPNDIETTGITFNASANEIYREVLTASVEESKVHPDVVSLPSDEE